MADKKEKPSWLTIANVLINFGLLVVAILALILKQYADVTQKKQARLATLLVFNLIHFIRIVK